MNLTKNITVANPKKTLNENDKNTVGVKLFLQGRHFSSL
jgi:hypothetical protein